MLETDCLIPYKPVPIPHREFYALHGDALSVKTLIDNGLGKWAILKKLRISEDAYNDAVYEINKQKAVTELNHYYEKENEEMPRGEKLDAETVERIRELKAAGKTVKEITEEVGCGKSTVGRICQHGTSQINKEFDDAVNQMIAESNKPEVVEQVAEPVEMTEEHTVNVPDAVMQAVADKIETLSAVLSDNLLTIKKMQQDNEQIRSELAVLYGWRAEHEGAEN